MRKKYHENFLYIIIEEQFFCICFVNFVLSYFKISWNFNLHLYKRFILCASQRHGAVLSLDLFCSEFGIWILV